jgi:FtsP/CotA-like multicopper oxidase with cupredoxin domain
MNIFIDTFFFDNQNPDLEVKVRLYTDSFTGAMILHCHFLGHEDLGMMAEYLITGNEGNV